jgi:hypothetical protein
MLTSRTAEITRILMVCPTLTAKNTGCEGGLIAVVRCLSQRRQVAAKGFGIQPNFEHDREDALISQKAYLTVLLWRTRLRASSS